MPEKHDLLAAIRGSGTRHRGNPAFAKAYLRGRYNGGAFTKTVQSTQRCAPLSPSSFVTFFDFAGLSSILYITSVFIGYIGTDSIGSLIKRFAAKKAGVEDGRNQ